MSTFWISEDRSATIDILINIIGKLTRVNDNISIITRMSYQSLAPTWVAAASCVNISLSDSHRGNHY